MRKLHPILICMIVAVPIVSLYFGVGRVQAANFYWNGGGGANSNWSTGANWVGSTAPGSGSLLNFEGTTSLFNTNNTTANNTYGLIFSNGAGAFILNGNAIDMAGITNFSANAQTINLAMSLNGNNQVISNAASGQITINGIISGSGGLTIAGANSADVVALNGVDTFSGGTTISSGTLAITNDNNLGSSGTSITFSSGGSGTLQITNTFTSNRMIALGPSGSTTTGTISVVGNSSWTNSNNIQASSNGGNPTLVKSGSGTLVIANTVDDNGLLLVASNGTVVLNTAASGGHAVSSVVSVAPGATVQLNSGTGGSEIYNGGGSVLNMNGTLAFNTGTQGINQFSGAGTGIVTNMTTSLATLTVNNNNASSTFGGAIVDGSGNGQMALVISENALTLTGTNTFTGGATINSGALLQIGNGGAGSMASFIVNNGSLVFDVSSVSSNTGVISGGGPLSTIGSGTTWLLGANTFSGNTTISAGTLAITNANGLGSSGSTIYFTGTGTLQVTNNIAINHPIVMNSVSTGVGTINVAGNSSVFFYNTGTGGFAGGGTQSNTLYKSGAGTFTISNNNDDNGLQMNVVAGTLVLADTNATSGHAVSTITGVSNGATLQLATTYGQQIYGGSVAGFNGVFNMNGVLAFNSASQSFDVLTGTGVVMGVTNFLSALTLGTANGSSTFGGSIQDGTTGGQMGLIKTGSGVLTLTGTNTLSGGATISSGQIVLGSGVAMTNSVITIGVNNGLVLSNATAVTIGGLSGSGTLSLLNTTNGAVALSIGNNSSNTTYSGVMSGSGGSLNKVGNGTTTLSSANTYTGPTIISSGTLLLSGSGAVNNSTTITVGTSAGAAADFNVSGVSGYMLASGQTLKGAGTVTGGLTVGNNSTISPGNSPGTLSLGNTTLSSGGNYVWEINSASTTLGTGKGVDPGYDWENIAGVLDITATSSSKFNIDITGLTLSDTQGAVNNWNSSDNYSWILATASGGITGFATNEFTLNATAFTVNNSLGGGVFSITTSGNNLLLDFTAAAVGLGTNFWAVSSSPAGGNWDTLSSNWNTNPTTNGTTAAWANGDYAVFSATNIAAGAYTVTVTNAGVSATGISVQSGGLTVNGGSVTLTGTAAITVSNGQSATISSVIAGIAGLDVNGPGTLTLNGANIYSGATVITNGTLVAGANFVITNTSALLIANNGTFTNNFQQAVASIAGAGNIILGSTGVLSNGFDNTSTTFSGVISGSGALAKYGTGTLVLGGANSYTGGTAISNGTVYVSADNNLGAAGGALAFGGGTLETTNNFTLNNRSVTLASAGGTISVDQLSTLIVTNVISGAGSLTKSGSGTLTLSGVNTYSGATLVNNGTLQAGANFVIANNSALVVGSGATFTDNFQQAVGSIAGTGNIILGSNGALSNGFDNTSTTFSGVISGSGTLAKYGTGTLTLSGANTYSGATVVGGGTLQAGANFVIASNSALVVANGATFNDNFQEAVGSIAGAGNIVLGASGALSNGFDNTSTTYSGLISGAGTLAKYGTGTLTLSGANTYSGNTIIGNGTVFIGADNNLGAGGGTVALGGGTLQVTNSFTLNNRNVAINSGNGTISVLGNSVLMISNPVTASITTLMKAGQGTLVLTGSTDNGGLQLSVLAGTTVLAKQSVSPPLPEVHAVGIVMGVSNGATLQLGGTGGDQIYDGYTGFSGLGFYGVFNMNGTFDLNGRSEGIDCLTGSGVVLNSTTGASVLTVGTDDGASRFDGSIQDGSGGGTMALTKTGTNVFVLTGTNTYSGATTISNGVLVLANAVGMTNSTVTVSVNSGLAFSNSTSFLIGGLSGGSNFGLTNTAGQAVALSVGNNSSNTTYSGVMSGSGGLVKIGGGILTLNGANTYSGGTAISNGTVYVSADNNLGAGGGSLAFSGGSLETSGSFILNNRAVTLNGGGTFSVDSSQTLTITNVISGTGFLAKSGAGTLTLGGVNTYSGATIVSNGTLQASANFVIAKNSAVIIASGATFTDNFQQAVGSIAGAGNIILGANGALSNGFDNTSTIYSGVISGAGALAKFGNGTLLLTATNTYGGGTSIGAGTLRLTGMIAGVGDVTVASTGSLSGSGVVSGRVTNAGIVLADSATPLRIASNLFNQASGVVTANNGGLVVGGLFTNSGNVAFVSSTGTFSSPTVFNQGTVALNSSTLNAANAVVTNASTGAINLNDSTLVGKGLVNTGTISGFGTISATSVLNSGTLVANNTTPLNVNSALLVNQAGGVIMANNAGLVVAGVFTNAGAVNMINSVGTFNSGVVNEGAWVTDPTKDVFQNTFTVTSSGSISMSSGDVYVFTNGATTAASFVNLSTQSNTFNTLNGKFVFDNTLGLTQNFVVAGHDLGPGVGTAPVPNATNSVEFGQANDPIPGFSNNFALGTLEISAYSTVEVSDAFLGLPGLGTNDDLTAGLYVNNLIMGLDSLLIISSNVEVYFESSNTWGAANYVLQGNPTYNNQYNGLHQLVVVPEPGVLFLWISGVATAVAARRRARTRKQAGRMT